MKYLCSVRIRAVTNSASFRGKEDESLKESFEPEFGVLIRWAPCTCLVEMLRTRGLVPDDHEQR